MRLFHPNAGVEGDGVMKRAMLLGVLTAGLFTLTPALPKAPGHVPSTLEKPAAQPGPQTGKETDTPSKDSDISEVEKQAHTSILALKQKVME